MGSDLAEAWELVEAGDVPGAMRLLRFCADKLAIQDLAQLVERTAARVGFDDLVSASSALAAAPDDPVAMYEFGYVCIERGASYLAIPALSVAVRELPDVQAVFVELAAALEAEGRHREAVAVLEERDAILRSWPDRYLLVFNALMAGDLVRATDHFRRLSEPDEQWQAPYERVRRMLHRAALTQTVSTLDLQDLRGWHFALTGGMLGTLSPYGFQEGMTGRYAFQQDGFGSCLYGLRRLRLILDTAGRQPRTVSLLPDRSSQILGLATAKVLGVPAEPFAADRPDTVVVAYDLNEVDGEFLAQLPERAPGQVLYEHATCWTEPPAVSADVSTLLRQSGTAPWGERLRQGPEGSAERVPADTRSVEELAAEVMRANAEPEQGDGESPADPDETLAGFVAGVKGQWLVGPRDWVRSSGPVPSSRFL